MEVFLTENLNNSPARFKLANMTPKASETNEGFEAFSTKDIVRSVLSRIVKDPFLVRLSASPRLKTLQRYSGDLNNGLVPNFNG